MSVLLRSCSDWCSSGAQISLRQKSKPEVTGGNQESIIHVLAPVFGSHNSLSSTSLLEIHEAVKAWLFFLKKSWKVNTAEEKARCRCLPHTQKSYRQFILLNCDVWIVFIALKSKI